MPEAVIVDAIRTPIGRAGKGSLKTVRADDLAAIPIRALMQRNPDVEFSETTDVLMGAASGVGEQGYNVGRNAALLAGLDHHVPGCTVNRFCASSLMTIRMASHAVRAGEGDQYIAAGVEAMAGRPDAEAGDVPADRWVAVEMWDDEMEFGVRVSDSGPGIPPERIPGIFTPGYTTKPGSGHGLGLALVDQIVRRHGGRVAVSRGEGGGAVFEVTVPRRLSAGAGFARLAPGRAGAAMDQGSNQEANRAGNQAENLGTNQGANL